MDKVPCVKCGKKVLPSTIKKTGGLCMPCFKGPNKKSFMERAEDIAVRMGLMKDPDRVARAHSKENSLWVLPDLEEAEYGREVSEILSYREKEEDEFLVSHILGLLMEKENKLGIDSFSEEERAYYLVSDMIRLLDSGGFSGYFFNSGHSSNALSRSLEKIGSVKCKEIVDSAITKLGKALSEDYDDMLEELAQLTSNFDDNLWENEDDLYFDLDENLTGILMDYVSSNKSYFSL